MIEPPVQNAYHPVNGDRSVGFEVIMPFAATIIAALMGVGGVKLSNRAQLLRERTAQLLKDEEHCEAERRSTRETILVLSTNIEHVVTELKNIHQEWRADRLAFADWQRHVEARLGSVEGRVDLYHGRSPDKTQPQT